ncbi:hypothetical protein BCR39DRAFT_569930 [Naematelia encephala]|uniref:Uncharacterized protein n=1 Tax=Naematelia encephala TaxID=71784 RepID=A0A1Y2AFL2_9TREE|nr:hypothetical protein BCR39DRAFT_569930 [Naematelia encephala]
MDISPAFLVHHSLSVTSALEPYDVFRGTQSTMTKSQSSNSGVTSNRTSLATLVSMMRKIQNARSVLQAGLRSPPSTFASREQPRVDDTSRPSLSHEVTSTTPSLPSTSPVLPSTSPPLPSTTTTPSLAFSKTQMARGSVLLRLPLQVSHVGTSQAGRANQTKFESLQHSVDGLALDDRTTLAELASISNAYQELYSAIREENPQDRWRLTDDAAKKLYGVVWETNERLQGTVQASQTDGQRTTTMDRPITTASNTYWKPWDKRQDKEKGKADPEETEATEDTKEDTKEDTEATEETEGAYYLGGTGECTVQLYRQLKVQHSIHPGEGSIPPKKIKDDLSIERRCQYLGHQATQSTR